MTITGSHVMIFSKDPVKDNKFFKDVLKFPFVSMGDGWLIFGLPPTEMMVGTASKEDGDDKDVSEEKKKETKKEETSDGGALPSGTHQLLLMCDDIKQFIKDAKELGVECVEPKDEGWGILSHFDLPGGSTLHIYEPKHEFPKFPKSIDILNDTTTTETNDTKQDGTTNGKHALPAEESKETKKAKA